MKKIVFFAIGLLFVCNIRAQKNNHTVMESGVGVSTYLNYPAVSVLSDACEKYSSVRESVLLGRRHGQVLYGFKVQYQQDMSTSMLNEKETMNLSAFSLTLRDYASFGEKVEGYIGMNLGLSYTINKLEASGVSYDFNRFGFLGEFEIGLQCRLSESTFMGINGCVDIGRHLKKDLELPATYTQNSTQNFNGYHIAVVFGVRL